MAPASAPQGGSATHQGVPGQRTGRRLAFASLALAVMATGVFGLEPRFARALAEDPAPDGRVGEAVAQVSGLVDAIRTAMSSMGDGPVTVTDFVRLAATEARKLGIEDPALVAEALRQAAGDLNLAVQTASRMRLAAALISGEGVPEQVNAPPKTPQILLPDAPTKEIKSEPTPTAGPDGPVTPAVSASPDSKPPTDPATGPPPPQEPQAPEGGPAPTLAVPAVDMSSLERRAAAYNRPTEMRLNRPVDVSFVIDATAAPNPTAPLEGFPGSVIETEIETTDRVVATLTGVNFTVESQTLERQVLSPFQANRWQWQVTPTADGEQVLILEVFAFPAGSEDALPIRTYRDRISVAVEDQEKIVNFARSWQPVVALIAAVLSGLVAGFGLWGLYKRRKAEKLAAAQAGKTPPPAA